MTVNNSTIINKMNKHFLPKQIEHKKGHDIKCGSIKPVNRIHIPSLDN